MFFALIMFKVAYSQKEGQDFCKGDTEGSYFPLQIKKKKLLWSDTYYFETFEKDTVVNRNNYLKFKQVWKNGDTDVLLLRERRGTVMQYYPESKKEVIRFDPSFRPGHIWKNETQDATYKIIGYNEKFETPFCKYEGLLAIRAEYPTVTYVFYYLKGYGYIAAARDGKIISAASPNWKE